MKIFSRMLYIVLEQQWISSTMTKDCQWSSRSRTILERIAAGSGSIIAENVLRTSTNKEVWIASILGNWGGDEVEFRIPHTKEHRGAAQKRMPRNAELSAYANNAFMKTRLSFWSFHVSFQTFCTLCAFCAFRYLSCQLSCTFCLCHILYSRSLWNFLKILAIFCALGWWGLFLTCASGVLDFLARSCAFFLIWSIFKLNWYFLRFLRVHTINYFTSCSKYRWVISASPIKLRYGATVTTILSSMKRFPPSPFPELLCGMFEVSGPRTGCPPIMC